MNRTTRLLGLLLTGGAFLLSPPSVHAQNTGTTDASSPPETIEVVGQRQHYRGDVPLIELPQNVQTLSGDLLKQLDVTRLDEALDLSGSVARQNNFGGLWDAYAIRGFAGDENVPSGFLVNGFNGGRGFGGPRDVSNVDKIEILKGPDSALFGRGEPGGTVNIITKQPKFEEPTGSISASIGSYDAYRTDVDATGAVLPWLAARFNGAYENDGSFRDTVKTEKYILAPSFLAQLSDSDSLSYSLYDSYTTVPFDRGIIAVNGVFLVPNSRFLGEPGNGPTRADALDHQLEYQHKFDNDWVLLAGFGDLETSLRGFGEDPEFAAARQPLFTTGNILSRRRISRDYKSSDRVPRAELSGRFETFGLVHHLLTGVDYEDFILDQVQGRFRPPVFNPSLTLAQMNAINIYNPVYGILPPLSPFTNKVEKDITWGGYIHDQIDVTQEIKIRAGLRYDDFHQALLDRLANSKSHQHETALSPTVGAVYEFNPNFSVYASYGMGFRPNTGFDAHGNAFKPETTRSYEIGAKAQALDGMLSGTLALYTMQKSNVLTSDPFNAGFSLAIGSAKSKGVELDVTGQLPWQMQLWLSYAYTDAYVASTVLDPDFGRVTSAGAPLINVPGNSLSALLIKSFDVYDHGASVGVGLNFVDRRLGETGTNFYLPSYTIVRLLGSFDVTDNFQVSAEITNLFDEVYYPSSYAQLWVNPGAPREFSIKGTYRF